MTVYRIDIGEEEPIKQGDIFTNIPYITFDLLVKSTHAQDKPLENQRDDIFEEILKNRTVIQVETFISSTTAILASQDCDIEQGNHLIFFPLKKVPPWEPTRNIKNYFDVIRKLLVKFYLPKINHPRFGVYGPFYAFLRTPITIPKDLIKKNLDYCWLARIKETARKFFIGRLTHFFSRPPIEELIFATRQEIMEYIRNTDASDKTAIINRIKFALFSCQRNELYYEILAEPDIRELVNEESSNSR